MFDGQIKPLTYFLEFGFLGVYNPPTDTIKSMIFSHLKNSTFPQNFRKRRALTEPFTGIKNPTTCINFNEVMLFSVSNKYFPQYDEDNLFNTNPNFDFGAFKDLAEQHNLMETTSTLFAFRFQSEGVYVFKMSSSSDLRMVC